jgi:hypothetical protein
MGSIARITAWCGNVFQPHELQPDVCARLILPTIYIDIVDKVPY